MKKHYFVCPYCNSEHVEMSLPDRARAEYAAELNRELIDEHKERLRQERNRKSWFPWRIKLERV